MRDTLDLAPERSRICRDRRPGSALSRDIDEDGREERWNDFLEAVDADVWVIEEQQRKSTGNPKDYE
jgi:hypothetical protein